MSPANRRVKILQMTTNGLSAREIARKLHCSLPTVYNTRHEAKGKKARNGQPAAASNPALSKIDGAIELAQQQLEKLRSAREIVAQL